MINALWIILIGVSFITASDIQTEIEDILREEFSSDFELSLHKYKLPEELKSRAEKQVQQKFFKEYIYLWNICLKDSLAGYAVLDNTYGKSLPITFLVIFSPVGKILKTEIIRYREPYGGAVGSRRWLDQFKGKSVEDKFNVDKDIDSISGATISVHSLTRAINKLTYIINMIISDSRYKCYKKQNRAESNAK